MLEDKALPRGVPTLVAEAITATGTANVRPFSVLGVPGAINSVICQAIGTFTAFSGNIEASSDGQTTWSIFAAFDFVSTNAKFITFDAFPGLSYRFNVSVITQTVAPSIRTTLK